MLLEHLIYSTAIAVIVGMLYFSRTGREASWIIVASAFIPDLDIIADAALKKIDMTVLINGNPIRHGDIHNIAMLLLFAFFTSLILQIIRLRLLDSLLFAGIGFGAHLLEDALVFNPGYSFFWPLSNQKFGIGLVEYESDWFGMANSEVLAIGMIVLILSVSIRTMYEGNGWLKKFKFQ